MTDLKEYDVVELTEDLVPGKNYDAISSSGETYKKGSQGCILEFIDSKDGTKGALIELSYKDYKNFVIGVSLTQIKKIEK